VVQHHAAASPARRAAEHVLGGDGLVIAGSRGLGLTDLDRQAITCAQREQEQHLTEYQLTA
jgi:hypothetical protein